MENWALGYNSINFWDFPNVSWFSKILRHISLGNSWGNSYISSLLPIFMLRLTCGEKEFGKVSKILKILYSWFSPKFCFAYVFINS